MRPLAEMSAAEAQGLTLLLTDIDGTLTDPDGRVPSGVFSTMEAARRDGLLVVPVTGRPAGWCDLIARTWPVDGVIGENGGLVFRRSRERLTRWFAQADQVRIGHRRRLEAIATRVLTAHPGAALASDQPYREFDLAIDFCEDVAPLPWPEVDEIAAELRAEGLHVKVSSIHVNAWFGDFDKATTCLRWARTELGLDLEGVDRQRACFFGDSPNDAPLFAVFDHGIGVANVQEAAARMDHLPRWITRHRGAEGFIEGVGALLDLRQGLATG